MEPHIDQYYKLFINGKWRDSRRSRSFTTSNPATGQVLATCVNACAEDIERAVDAAWKAFSTWKKTSPKERSRLLLQIADIIDANAGHLAMVETLDNGKPINESREFDIPMSADHFRYFAAAIRSHEGQATMLDDATMSIILREPVGVVGQIIPWNFPLLMASWKIAPALAAGNCVVIKPSSETPLSLLELAKLLADVVPPGVLNIVTGKGTRAGAAILENERFSKLAFTGSTEIGYLVAESAAKRIIPATLELGGKSANIFFPDAPWEKALVGMQHGILFNQGEVCTAGSRVFIHKDIYDRFLEAAVDAFSKVKVGMPWEQDTQMGALVNERQLQKILAYLEVGRAEGAQVAFGGKRITEAPFSKGTFIQPTLLANVTNSMLVAREEIFGPVACCIKFEDEEEAIAMANDNQYGLCGAVWTRDINRAIRVARGVQTGRMWVNTYNILPAHAPFGGYKKSGLGRESHKDMLDHYSQTKNIFISMKEDDFDFY